MDDWGSHVPVLGALASAYTNGKFLELGAGDYSTPLLHNISYLKGCLLLTLETDQNWLNKYFDMLTPWHKLRAVKDWDLIYGLPEVKDQWFNLIFVDHAPGERRIIDIERFMNKCDYMVVHDTQVPHVYGYDQVFPKFKYQYTYKRFPTWTTVLSNTNNPNELFSN